MLGQPIEQLVLIPTGKAQVVSNYALPDQVFLIRARSYGENEILLMHDQGIQRGGDFVDNLADTNALMVPCGDGSYCCGNRTEADQCCGASKGLFVVDGEAVSREAKSALDIVLSLSTKATSSSSSSSALNVFPSFGALSSTASVSSSSTASASPSVAAKPSYPIGVIVGVALGGGAAIAFMTGIVVLIWIYCKKRRARSHGTHQDHQAHGFLRNNATHDELAITGPPPELEDSEATRRLAPELEDSEETRKRVPELEDPEPIMPELRDSSRTHRRVPQPESSRRSHER